MQKNITKAVESERVLRLTGRQHQYLFNHLYPGDNKESVAIALCGRCSTNQRTIITIHKIILIPYEKCTQRTEDQVEWPTELMMPLIEKAMKYKMAILKIHSHPTGYSNFSNTDDFSDNELFSSIAGWLDDGLPHASAVMLPNGEVFGRFITQDGVFQPIQLVSVCGDELKFWFSNEATDVVHGFAQRHAQAFGAGTTNLLRNLSIAVVGVSGTGSPIIQALARLGVGKLVLIDPDIVEEKNLNRIIGSTCDDVSEGRYKVDVLTREIHKIGLGTEVTPVAKDLSSKEAIYQVACCDVAIGCMDSVDGRDILNRIAIYYAIPYFDVGIRLDADGRGGIDQICGSVHYLQPDGSSLLSRGVYTSEQLRAAGLQRTAPEEYEKLIEEKYIFGVEEDRPAVISVNMLFASLLVNELLARLHPYKDDDNKEFAAFSMSLSQSRLLYDNDGEPCVVLAKKAGRGDATPLLGLPVMSNSGS